MSSRPPFEMADRAIEPGARERIELPVARITTGGLLALTVEVVHGVRPGPTLWLTGAIHGDELDGIEIIRRTLERLDGRELAGTVLAVPLVNLFGFIGESRYLPDRRDLNRSFPGSATGSLASRLAHKLMTEVVARGDWGIDFHCGSDDRENLPQVRADLDDDDTRRLALAFGAPLAIHGKAPDGALRKAALKAGCRTLLYEGGEAGRFTEQAIRGGKDGVHRVMQALGMLEGEPEPVDVLVSRAARWVRAGRSGVCRLDVGLGDRVGVRERLGEVTDPFGGGAKPVRARSGGILISRRVNPLVYQGEAVAHIAELGENEAAPG